MSAAPGGEPIRWADEPLAEAMRELRARPGGAEALKRLGSECLAAMILASLDLSAEAALEAVLRTAEWRESSGAATARARLRAVEGDITLRDLPHGDKILEHLPMHDSGRSITRDQMPYSVRCVGLTDAEALFEAVTEEDFMEFSVSTAEMRLLRLEAYASREGRLGRCTSIQDMTCPEGILNVWLRNRGRQPMLRTMSHTIDTYYPGMLGKVLLINAPWAVHGILKVLWPVLPARIADKIETVSASQTPARLRELVDPAHLPCFLGGDIPDDEFVPSRKVPSQGSGDEEVEIAAGTRDERRIRLEAGHIAAYGFTVQGGSYMDIMFKCHFEVDGGDTVEVSGPERIKEATGGTFTAPAPGRLVLEFDNSYSWLNSKTITFELSQLPPDADAAAPA